MSENKISKTEKLLKERPNQALQALTEVISEKCFNRPFNHVVYFNARLRSTGGRYHIANHNIDINPKMFTEHDLNTLIGVIKHELCHYHLDMNGMNDGHGKNFKTLLKSVGGSRYAPAPKRKYENQYFCLNCGVGYVLKGTGYDSGKHKCPDCHRRLFSKKHLIG